MTRPGVVVTSRVDAPPRSAPTDTGMAFMVGQTGQGADVATVQSMTQYEAEFGPRTGFTDAYDAAEVYFREGGGKLAVARVGAPTVAAASSKSKKEAATEEDDTAGARASRGVAADVGEALDRFTRDMGPGQVFVAGGEAYTSHADLLAHAATNNRIALLSADPASDAAALTTLATTLAADENGRYGALFAPGAIVPGVTSADTRAVDFAPIEAGIIARNDVGYTANIAAAGVNGESRFAIDVAAVFTDAEREALNTKGVDIARVMYGGVRAYGYRTLAPLDSGWGLLSNARLNMEIVAQADVIGERYVFAQIDGRGTTLSQFAGDLTGMLVPYYEGGALFGTSVQDAFYVDVGPGVNTPESIAAGELRAVIALRMSPFAELVVIEIVKVATETPLAIAA